MGDFSEIVRASVNEITDELSLKYSETYRGLYVLNLGEIAPREVFIVTDMDVYSHSGHNPTEVSKGILVQGVWMCSHWNMQRYLGKTPEEAAASVWDCMQTLKMAGEQIDTTVSH